MALRRWRYVRRYRPWLEANKWRIFAFTKRMVELRLYAATGSDTFPRCGIISMLAKMDGIRVGNWKERHRWLDDSGWRAFQGWSNTERLKAKRGEVQPLTA